MATKECDINRSEFTVGDYVSVRCLVTAITPVQTGSSNFGGSGDSVSLTVQSPNTNDKVGVTLVVSPQQCRKAGNKDQG